MVHETLLSSQPEARIQVQYVWVRAFAEDGPEVAQALSIELSDERARHYWDRGLTLGKSLSEHLFPGFNMPFAWDVYMFFDGQAGWGREPPEPVRWLHQMNSIATDHYCAPRDLAATCARAAGAAGVLLGP